MPASGGALPNEMVVVLLGGLSNFDRKELLSPATLTPIFAAVESRPTGSKAAMKEARAGDLGGAAMTALGDGDQVLATFLKGLEFYQKARSRSRRHAVPELDADGADVCAVAAVHGRRRWRKPIVIAKPPACCRARPPRRPTPPIARLAGEEWIKAGQPQLAITPLELAMQQPGAEPRTRKLLGIAYVLGGRPVTRWPR